MSDPEEDLTRALRQRAGGASGSLLTLESVQRRARGIRRRRQALAVLAAAAAVAVVVPVGVGLGGRDGAPGPPAATRPSALPDTATAPVPAYQVTADPPADQTSGAALTLPYWYDDQIVDTDGSTMAINRVTDQLVRVTHDEWVGVAPNPDGVLQRITALRTGIVEAEGIQSARIGVTPDGGQYAYLSNLGTAQRFDWQITRDGRDPMTWAVNGDVTGDSGVAGILSDGTVIATASSGRIVAARSSGSLDTFPGGYLRATTVSTTTDRIAVQVSARADGTSCWAVVDAAGARQARTCRWQLTQFSPDGRYLLGADSASDGAGPRELVLLDATTLRLAARFTADADGYFGQAAWTGDTVVAPVFIDGTWYVELLRPDAALQVRGFAAPGEYGDPAPIRFAAGPLAAP